MENELTEQKQGFLKTLLNGGEFEVKLISTVTDGISNNVLNVELDFFPVGDNGVIKFGPNGFSLYHNRDSKIPPYLDCHVAILEDDSGIRQKADLMSRMKRTSNLMELPSKLLARRLNPVLNFDLNLAELLLDTGLKILTQNGDELWLRGYFTFNYTIDGYKGDIEIESDDAIIKLSMVTA